MFFATILCHFLSVFNNFPIEFQEQIFIVKVKIMVWTKYLVGVTWLTM